MNVGSLQIDIIANLARLQTDMNKANQTVDSAMRNIDKSVGVAKNAFAGLVGSLGVGSIIKLADEYKRFDSQLKLATKSTKEYEQAYSRVLNIARTSQSDVGAIGVLYARLSNNLKEFGTSQKDIGNITESVALSLRVSNATVQETNSVMLQLSQSFGSGRINGQEFLAVSEGAPIIMRQLAKSLGVTYGELKELSSQGKLTSEALKTALTDPAYLAGLQEQVKSVGTISSAMTVLINNLKVFIGEQDKASGAGQALAQTIIFIGDNLNTLANVGFALLIGRIAQSVTAIRTKIVASQAERQQIILTSIAEQEATAKSAADTARVLGLQQLKATAKLRIAEANVLEAKSSLEVAAGTAREAGALAVLESATYKAVIAKGQLAKVNGVVGVSMANNASATTLLAAQNAKLAASATAASNAIGVKAGAVKALSGVISLLGGALGVTTIALTGFYFWINKALDEKKLDQYGTAIDGIRERAKTLQKQTEQGLGLNNAFAGELSNIKDLEKARDGLFTKLKAQEKLKRTDSIFFNEESYKKTAIEYVQATKDIENAQKDLSFSVQQYNEKIAQSNKKVTESSTSNVANIKEAANAKKQADEEEKRRREQESATRLSQIEHEYTVKANRADDLLDKIAQEDEAKEKIYKADLKRIKDLQEIANDNFKKAQDAQKELDRESKQISQDLGRSLTDALFRGFESGKSFAENFKDTLLNSFRTLVLSPSIEFLINSSGIGQVLAGITGGATSVSGLAGQSGGGIGGLFSSIGSIFDRGNSSIVGAIEGFGASISNGLGGIRDSIGGFIGQNSALIGKIAPFASVGLSLLQGDVKGALGAGLGAALSLTPLGPVGGIIGSLVGGSLFGGKKQPPRQAGVGSASFINGVLTSSGGAFGGRTTTNAGIAGGLEQATAAFASSVGTLLAAFGKDGNVTAFAKYLGRAKSSAFFQIGSTVEGKNSFEVGKYKDAFSEANFQQFIDRLLGVEIVKVIQNSSLSDGVKKFFDGLTKKEDVLETINTLSTLNQALKNLPPIFDAVRNAIDTTAYTTSIQALQAQFQATQTFVELFYSETEKFDIFTGQIIAQFEAINVALPRTAKEYRDMVEAIEVVDEATRDQFNGLIALAPAFDSYLKQLEAQKQLTQQIAGIDINKFRTFLDFNVARSYVGAGLNIPAANMPSYDVGTSYVPNDGIAMLHQGEAVLTRSDNQSMTSNTSAMVSLLNRVVSELNDMKLDIKRGADSSVRTARELEDITGGDIVLLTQAA